jgi:hypothetical protein
MLSAKPSHLPVFLLLLLPLVLWGCGGGGDGGGVVTPEATPGEYTATRLAAPVNVSVRRFLPDGSIYGLLNLRAVYLTPNSSDIRSVEYNDPDSTIVYQASEWDTIASNGDAILTFRTRTTVPKSRKVFFHRASGEVTPLPESFESLTIIGLSTDGTLYAQSTSGSNQYLRFPRTGSNTWGVPVVLSPVIDGSGAGVFFQMTRSAVAEAALGEYGVLLGYAVPSDFSTGATQAAYVRDGRLTRFPRPFENGASHVAGMNAAGIYIGFSSLRVGDTGGNAFVWYPDQTLDLGTDTTALSINDAGTVFGTTRNDPAFVVWNRQKYTLKIEELPETVRFSSGVILNDGRILAFETSSNNTRGYYQLTPRWRQ